MRKSTIGRTYISRTIQKILRKYIIDDQKKIDKRMRVVTQLNVVLEQRGWSIKDLASRVGKRPGELRRMFDGRVDISAELLAKIENALSSSG